MKAILFPSYSVRWWIVVSVMFAVLLVTAGATLGAWAIPHYWSGAITFGLVGYWTGRWLQAADTR